MRRSSQRGYTLRELLFVGWAFVCLSFFGFVLFIAWHFISKFW